MINLTDDALKIQEKIKEYTCVVLKFLPDKIQIFENSNKGSECKKFIAKDQKQNIFDKD